MSIKVDERLTLLGLAVLDDMADRKSLELRILELEQELAKATGKVVTMNPSGDDTSTT